MVKILYRGLERLFSRMLAALLEEQGSVSSTHTKWLATAHNSDVMLSNLQGHPTHMTHIDIEIDIKTNL